MRSRSSVSLLLHDVTMDTAELPEVVAAFALHLVDKGFDEIRRERGTMDSALIVLRRSPVEIWLTSDRSEWSASLCVDGWRDSVAFPLFEGFGRSGADAGDLAPRRSRDPARHYPVPEPVRWLVRQLLGARFEERDPPSSSTDRFVFRRTPVTVWLLRDEHRWSVDATVEGWPERDQIIFPPFNGFADE
jgi:hypothetical protein